MKRISGVIALTGIAVAVLLSLTISPETFGQSAVLSGAQSARGSGVPSELFGNTGIITSITNTLLYIAGALAVIMIIYGGLRYATSAGNATSISAAKNTILYAIVGLIIAFLAFAAVNWVLTAITPGGEAGFTNI
jgi:lysylphosphatidylglycerol synthetase-like protein (DUF2156 family)